MKDVARECDMSESSLQKKIRLEEAKNLLVNKNIGVAQAAFDVGYESVSQFSREYARMFGMPPKVHSEILRSGVAS